MLVAVVGRRLRSVTEVVFTAEVGNGDAPGLRLFTKPFSTNVGRRFFRVMSRRYVTALPRSSVS